MLVLGNHMECPGTWGFYLKELDEGRTRLVIRGRGGWEPGLLSWLGAHVLFEPAHFVMERKMMLGIKSRAESLGREEAPSKGRPSLTRRRGARIRGRLRCAI